MCVGGELPVKALRALFGCFAEGSNDFSAALRHRLKAFCSSWKVVWGLPPTSLNSPQETCFRPHTGEERNEPEKKKKSTRELLLQELYLQLAHPLVTMKHGSQQYYYRVLRKGRASLPHTSKEVYSQCKQSSSQDFRKDCVSMKCFWSRFSPRDAGCTPGKWGIPVWRCMKLMQRKRTAQLCNLLKLRGACGSPLCPQRFAHFCGYPLKPVTLPRSLSTIQSSFRSIC